jgi:hypothetical protein
MAVVPAVTDSFVAPIVSADPFLREVRGCAQNAAVGKEATMRLGAIFAATLLIASTLTAPAWAFEPQGDAAANDSPDYAALGPMPAGDVAIVDPARPATPRWSVTADALFLWRVRTSGVTLLDSQPEGEGVYDSADLRSQAAVGPRISTIFYGDAGWQFEGNFFAIDSWNATGSFPAPSVTGPVFYYGLKIDSANEPLVSTVDFDYRTRLYSTELNVRRRWNDWFTPLIGFRWTELNENYSASGEEYALPLPYDHAIKTTNNLYGCQIGADIDIWGNPASAFCGSFIGKVGLFYNAATQQSSFNDGPGGLYGAGSVSARRDCAAMVAELGLNAGFHITPHLTTRIGYQIFFLDGLALAPRQMAGTELLNTQTGHVDVGGDLILHGLTAEVEWDW